MDLVSSLIGLVIGFFLLIKGADFFVGGASGIASKFGIPQIVIGLTIVAIGTSAPEAAVSISAALSENADIAIGNVIGSNILNILLILGIVGCIVPLAVSKEIIKRDIPVIIGTTIILIVCCLDGLLSKLEGVILLFIFVGYLGILLKNALSNKDNKKEEKNSDNLLGLILITIAGLGMIVMGSRLTVDCASNIATAFGMSERLIGLTIVAFGTSLPELITSIVAARKGNADISVGNVVGSSIFNILFILGLTSLICPINVISTFIVDGTIALLACLLLFIFTFKDSKLGRAEAAMFLIAYGIYFVTLL